jgi:hypothetical protein
MTIEFHQLANLFPLMEGEEFEAFVEDIWRHGVREPIVLYQDQILDGRNRYRACQQAGVKCRFEPYRGSDPAAYVISLNLKRRHLNESQRAMVAAKLATFKLGDNQYSEGLPIGRGCELLNVGERTVARAREVQGRGTPELQRVVERGAISVSAAADVAGLPIEEQQQIVARGEREIIEAAKKIRAKKAEIRRTERVKKLLAISSGDTALPSRQRFPIIYADPPWQYEHPLSESRRVDNHYPTMELDAICALPVGQLATPDALLFIWSPPGSATREWPANQHRGTRFALLHSVKIG